VFDPASDGIDFYESLEAMLVQMNNAVAVGPTINDIVQTGTFTFKLRAERDERGSGRIYTLT
jgi:hypothetical protein